jgi:integrase
VLVAQREYTEKVQKKTAAVVRYVFHRDGTQIRSWRRAWTTALLAAGLATKDPETKKVTRLRRPHDFRRTAIRSLSRAGITEAVAMQLCGHETRSVYDRYNIVTGDDLRAAAEKLDAANCTSGKVSGKVASISGGRRKRSASK